MRAKEIDIQIREKENDITKRKKDLELEIVAKDREIEIKNKELEINLRLKELELLIREENKRTELIDVKRNNAVVEAEYEGRAQGKAVTEFIGALPSDLSVEQCIKLWMTLRELDKSMMLFSKVGNVHMYPDGTDLRVFQFGEGGKPTNNTLVVPDILKYSGDERT